jgi:hypothetical protein
MQAFQNIDKNEYWLLDSVVENLLFLSGLMVDNIEQAFNKKKHELTHNELLNTLEQLFQSGDIIAAYWQVEREPFSDFQFIPTKEEIESGLEGNQSANLGYQLTAQGGEKWESISNPNWELYYTPVYPEEIIKGEQCFMGGSRKILEEFLMFRLAHPFQSVNISSIKWEILEHWEATYWKTLPLGYQLSYSSENIPYSSQEDSIKDSAFSRLFFDWKDRNKWYTDPFDSLDL